MNVDLRTKVSISVPKALANPTIKIDTSQVPPDKSGHPDFLQLRAQIEAALANQKWRTAFAIHEAGHLIYLERAGFKDFLYFGPTIIYDAVKSEFNGFPASVRPQFGEINPEGFDFQEWFLAIAKGFAAGGVFAQKLTAAPDVGDQGDRGHFEAICDLVMTKDPNISINRDGLWELAQEAITKDLRSPAFCKEAWAKARELMQRLFGQS